MRKMSVSIDRLLKKIEEELHKAKQADNTAKLRENVHSIKVLCELILEEKQPDISNNFARPTEVYPSVQSVLTPSIKGKKVEEDEANGDSLFDF